MAVENLKKSLQSRNKKLAARLKQNGIDETIQNIHVLDETQYDFVLPFEAAERLLILLAIAYTAYNFEESEKVMDWLKNENLWKSVSEKEKEFLRNPDPEQEEKQQLSWRFEGAYLLAWALEKVHPDAEPGRECDEERVNAFVSHIPAVGTSTQDFFEDLFYRSRYEIVDEFLFYEMTTRYFRDIEVQHKENTSQVHPQASFEHHLVLHWLCHAESDWDATTSL